MVLKGKMHGTAPTWRAEADCAAARVEQLIARSAVEAVAAVAAVIVDDLAVGAPAQLIYPVIEGFLVKCK